MLACKLYMIVSCVYVNILGSPARECIWGAFGECVERCPPDTYSYSPGCVLAMSRRTCRAPVSRLLGEYCDYSRCDCIAPKVWDEAARKCVLFQQCSDQSVLTHDNEQLGNK